MHANKFGLVRLLLAFAVLLSHAVELTDGSRRREVLAQLTGFRTAGELAVVGFFLVSGFLVTQSLLGSRGLNDFFVKRALRLYPAFIVAFLVSAFVVAPMFGGALSLKSVAYNLMRMFKLDVPLVEGAFATLPVPIVNGSMWTISFEFRCYVLLAGLSLFDLRRIRAPIALGGAALLFANGVGLEQNWSLNAYMPGWLLPVTGKPDDLMHLCGVFLIGSAFYLYRGVLVYKGAWACAALVLTTLAASSRAWCDLTLAIAGGYALFWFIFSPGLKALNHVGATTDISYGLYLYAWPTQQIILSLNPDVSLVLSVVLTTTISAALGLLSWIMIERPSLAQKHRVAEACAAFAIRKPSLPATKSTPDIARL